MLHCEICWQCPKYPRTLAKTKTPTRAFRALCQLSALRIRELDRDRTLLKNYDDILKIDPGDWCSHANMPALAPDRTGRKKRSSNKTCDAKERDRFDLRDRAQTTFIQETTEMSGATVAAPIARTGQGPRLLLASVHRHRAAPARTSRRHCAREYSRHWEPLDGVRRCGVGHLRVMRRRPTPAGDRPS